jgi:hypothetical protein
MPTKPELSARAAELQKRYPFYTLQNCRTLAEIEAREARKPKPAKN